LKILVSGAAGFIGSHLAETLLRRGDQVIGLDNFNDYYDPARKRANIASFQGDPRLTFYEADIRDADRMQQIVAEDRPDVIAHIAAMASVRYSIGRAPLYADVNLRGTVNLLEAARLLPRRPFTARQIISLLTKATRAISHWLPTLPPKRRAR
jgi:UDP-glucuronate 4-epimerase